MPSRSSRWWTWLGLAGLVVLNVVLIALLLFRPTSADTSGPEQPSTSPFTPSTAPTEDETDSAEESGTDLPTAAPAPTEPPVESLEAAPAERVLVAASEWVAWRATVGECGAPGVLEHSVDGGQTWQEMPNELAPLSRIRALGTSTLFAIGGGGECQPVYLSSSTAGASWSMNNEYLSGSWFLDPADRDTMGAPVGMIDAPCEPVDLAGTDAANAGVLCTDGTLTLTSDGGATWQEMSPVIDARAIGVADGGYALAGADDRCDDAIALSVTDLTGAAVDEPSCTTAEIEGAADLAVGAVGRAVWLWADDEVLVSTDGGQTW